jgi:hypothetical protein
MCVVKHPKLSPFRAYHTVFEHQVTDSLASSLDTNMKTVGFVLLMPLVGTASANDNLTSHRNVSDTPSVEPAPPLARLDNSTILLQNSDDDLHLSLAPTSFQIYTADLLRELRLGDDCLSAATASIRCDDKLNAFRNGEATPYQYNTREKDDICNFGCGVSLASWVNGVRRSCRRASLTSNYPITLPGGYMWAGWNQTCLKDRMTYKYCSGTATKPWSFGQH